MTHILLYWNHICVLHRQEKAFLQELAGRLHREDIELEVRFFGLGYPEHMSEYLARPDAVLPDLIVSADLEVFEDRAIFSKMEPELYPAADWVSLRESPALDACGGADKLLPAAAIPLVYYTPRAGDMRADAAAGLGRAGLRRDQQLCRQDGSKGCLGNMGPGGSLRPAGPQLCNGYAHRSISNCAPGTGPYRPGALSLRTAGGWAEHLPPHAPRGAGADPVLSVRADLCPRVGGPAGGRGQRRSCAGSCAISMCPTGI